MSQDVTPATYNRRMPLRLVYSNTDSTRFAKKSERPPRALSAWPTRQAAVTKKLNRLIVLHPDAVRVVEVLIDEYLQDVRLKGDPI